MTQSAPQLKLEQLRAIAIKPPADTSAVTYKLNFNLILDAVTYLSSQAAFESIDLDPYWPKWNSPWWHLLLVHEMGIVSRVPSAIFEKMVRALDKHYLKFFPFQEEELPEDCDPFRHIACHCALGSMEQVLYAAGINVDDQLPWIREWYLKYQLPDGGMNCDEGAYTRQLKKSSIVSTLPPLEAVLFCTRGELTHSEIAFLDEGAKYLIWRHLFRNATTREIIDEDWTKLCFPRFYEYDILRGLNFLLAWADRLNRRLPILAIGETVSIIDAAFPDGRIRTQREIWSNAKSRLYNAETDEWYKGEATTFPLLEAAGTAHGDSPQLTEIWNTCKKTIASLIERKLIIDD